MVFDLTAHTSVILRIFKAVTERLASLPVSDYVVIRIQRTHFLTCLVSHHFSHVFVITCALMFILISVL